mgnify:CR=1 FL=1
MQTVCLELSKYVLAFLMAFHITLIERKGQSVSKTLTFTIKE